jgi:hypothetical protein
MRNIIEKESNSEISDDELCLMYLAERDSAEKDEIMRKVRRLILPGGVKPLDESGYSISFAVLRQGAEAMIEERDLTPYVEEIDLRSATKLKARENGHRGIVEVEVEIARMRSMIQELSETSRSPAKDNGFPYQISIFE